MSVFSEVFLATSDDLKALSQEMNAFELPRCERAGIACVLLPTAQRRPTVTGVNDSVELHTSKYRRHGRLILVCGRNFT